MGPAHNRACGVHANIVPCSRHQPTTVLNWPEQASSTNTPRGPPLSGSHLPIHLFQHIHHIQQNQNRGTTRNNVHPSRVKTSLWPVIPRNRSRQGESPELLITTTHSGFNAPVAPTYHPPQGKSLMANPDPLTTSPTYHHIT
jgi:hypothetical protein